MLVRPLTTGIKIHSTQTGRGVMILGFLRARHTIVVPLKTKPWMSKGSFRGENEIRREYKSAVVPFGAWRSESTLCRIIK